MNPEKLPAELSIPAELPIAAKAGEIIRAIRSNQVLIVAGETGSGKSTQLAKLCLAAGLGKEGMIGCTQPRRIAATSLAARVAEELGPAGEELVGYRIRFRDRSGEGTRIKFMTDGIILAEAARDRDLSRYEAIIVDEAHERSLNIDFLLGILRGLLPKRPELKVIITSATIDTDRFARAFSAPVIKVSGRAYPVEKVYRPPGTDSEGIVAEVVSAVAGIHRGESPGDVLVFLPTERDIRECVAMLREEFSGPEYRRAATVLPLFGRLAGKDQQRIFRPARGRKIVVATNVAETSLTVPGIRFVVDSGLARLSVYGARSGTAMLPVLPVSRASADQRAGRCGRVGPGVCIRLYDEDDYLSRPEFTLPEIQRSNLAEVILRMISLRLGDPASFPFLDPPGGRALSDGFRQLLELGAISLKNGRRQEARLTRVGRIMSRLPLDPRLSRMVIAGRENGCLAEAMVLASALAIQSPLVRPAEQEKEADQTHAAFQDPASDFLTLLNIWRKTASLKGLGALSRFCRKNFLSFQRMREWQDIHEQVRRIIGREKGFVVNRTPARPEAVHCAVLAGCLRGVGLRKEKNFYQISRDRKGMIFPGSALFNRGGTWIVAAEAVETGRLYLRTAANVKPEWIEEAAGPLLRRHHHSPRWEKRSGRVMALENVSIFGLPLAANRRVDYGRIDPAEAREIFITSALVEGELGPGFAFLDHNLSLIKELRDTEDRLRRRDLVVDDQTIFSLYDQRLAPTVRDRGSLAAYIKRGREKALFFSRDDLLISDDEQGIDEFPAEIEVDGATFAVEYSFNPGSEDDGLTVVVPVALAGMVRPQLFEWLVAGMREEKIAAMLKSLPKAKRRRLVPIPERARSLAAMVPGREGLSQALARAVGEKFGVEVAAEDFVLDRLPTHLRPRYRLVDNKGRTLALSRDFSEIISRSGGGRAKEGLASRLSAGEAGSFIRRDIEDPAEIVGTPERVPVTSGGRLDGFLFPFIRRRARGCFDLDLSESESVARQANRRAIPWLYEKKFNNFKAIKKELKLDRRDWALYQGLGETDRLAESIAAFVLARVFDCRDGLIPEADLFERNCKKVEKQGPLRLVRESMETVRQMLVERRSTADLIARLKTKRGKGGGAIFASMEEELGRLVGADFFDRHDFETCRLRPRHLKALALRAERAYVDPGRDARRTARVAPFAERTAAVAGQGLNQDASRVLADYELLLDEFRVAVFAQELGKAMPVSPAILEEKWRELKGLLAG